MLPETVTWLAPVWTETPVPELPEMTLQAPVHAPPGVVPVVPPMVFGPTVTSIPLPLLIAPVPAGFVPMRFPRTCVPDAFRPSAASLEAPPRGEGQTADRIPGA